MTQQVKIGAAHRPGPWEFQPTELTGHNFAGYIRQNGHVIAQVLHDRGTQFDGGALVPERDAANARLIAEAPALLAAALNVLANEPPEEPEIESYDVGDTESAFNNGYDRAWWEAAQYLKAAARAARGEA